jgi:uncharacterized membrane protein
MFERLRHYFLLGLVSIAPLAITAWILWRFYLLVDAAVLPWLQRIRPLRDVPGFFLTLAGLLAFLIAVTLVGLGARNIIGATFFGMVERWVSRVPIVKAIFGTTKQLGEVLFGDRRSAFQRVVLVEFPMPGTYSIGFVTADHGEGDLVCVFVANTPNPATGFALMVRRPELVPVAVTVEEGIRIVISGGALLTAEQMRAIVAGATRFPAPPGGAGAAPAGDDGSSREARPAVAAEAPRESP